jgi:hypothetical protein
MSADNSNFEFERMNPNFGGSSMPAQCASNEGYEISPHFRAMLEERISRLERDAVSDEAEVASLNDLDHIRRHMRLVAVQRAEALRMRLFLDRATTRLPQSEVAI